MAGKAVTSQKQGALVDWRGGDRIDTSRRAQLDRGFNVLSRSLARIARFDSRLDMSLNVIQMIDDWFIRLRRQIFIATNDVIAALQIQRARVVREQLCVSDYDRLADIADFCFRYRFEDDFRTYAGWITHRYADARSSVDGLIGLQGLIVHQPKATSPA